MGTMRRARGFVVLVLAVPVVLLGVFSLSSRVPAKAADDVYRPKFANTTGTTASDKKATVAEARRASMSSSEGTSIYDYIDPSPALDPAAFARDGVAGPLQVLTAEDLASLREKLPPTERTAGLFPDNPIAIALAERFSHIAEALIGRKVVMFSVVLFAQAPNQRHRWHADMQLDRVRCNRSVDVWVGIENVTAANALRVLKGSHTLRETPEGGLHEADVIYNVKTGEDDADERAAHLAANAFVANGKGRRALGGIAIPRMSDGDAFVFDGRAWHATSNPTSLMRRAVAVRYAGEECEIREYDYLAGTQLRNLPPVYGMLGTERLGSLATALMHRDVIAGKAALNLFVARTEEELRPLSGTVPTPTSYPALNQAGVLVTPGGPTRGGNGTTAWRMTAPTWVETPAMGGLNIHHSWQPPRKTPHAPHAHADSELMVIISGRVVITTVAASSPTALVPLARRISARTATAGEVVYHPFGSQHTITAVEPSSYFVARFTAASPEQASHCPQELRSVWVPDGAKGSDVFLPPLVQKGKPQYERAPLGMRALRAHSSVLQPGMGYEPHIDPYDVLLVFVQGRVRHSGCPIARLKGEELETIGDSIDLFEGDALYIQAGLPNGLRNEGMTTANYLAFELEKSPCVAEQRH